MGADQIKKLRMHSCNVYIQQSTVLLRFNFTTSFIHLSPSDRSIFSIRLYTILSRFIDISQEDSLQPFVKGSVLVAKTKGSVINNTLPCKIVDGRK
jgi:hypothetical protein